MCVCMCVYIRLHICTPRARVCMYVYMHACRVCRCVCAYLRVHTLLHLCVYVFTYTHAEFACACVQTPDNLHAVFLAAPSDGPACSVVVNISMQSCEITQSTRCPQAISARECQGPVVTTAPQQGPFRTLAPAQDSVPISNTQSVSLLQMFTHKYLLALDHTEDKVDMLAVQYMHCPEHSRAYVQSLLRCVCHSTYRESLDLHGHMACIK